MSDIDNTPDLTDAEAAAIADDAPAPVAAAPEVVPEPVVEPTPDPQAIAAEKMAAAADRIAAAADAMQARNEPTVTEVVETARDFDAEIAAAEARLAEIERKYEDGDEDISAADRDRARAEFRTTERNLIREQTRLEAVSEAQRIAAETANAIEEAAWKQAQQAFFSDPENAKLIATNGKKLDFTETVHAVAAETPGLTYEQLLVKAREKLTGVPAVDVTAQTAAAVAERARNAPVTPVSLREVPNAGATGDNPGASLDNLDISNLEDTLARMSDAQRAQYLADAPGGLRDNPRLVA